MQILSKKYWSALALLLCALFVLGACQNVAPTTSEENELPRFVIPLGEGLSFGATPRPYGEYVFLDYWVLTDQSKHELSVLSGEQDVALIHNETGARISVSYPTANGEYYDLSRMAAFAVFYEDLADYTLEFSLNIMLALAEQFEVSIPLPQLPEERDYELNQHMELADGRLLRVEASEELNQSKELSNEHFLTIERAEIVNSGFVVPVEIPSFGHENLIAITYTFTEGLNYNLNILQSLVGTGAPMGAVLELSPTQRVYFHPIAEDETEISIEFSFSYLNIFEGAINFGDA